MVEVKERAVTEIEVYEAIIVKNSNSQPKQWRYKESGRDHRPRNTDSSMSRRFDQRYVPYVAKKGDTKEGTEEEVPKPRFRVSYKLLITKESVVRGLCFPKENEPSVGWTKR